MGETQPNNSSAQALILVSGLVQGVYYRANTQKQALMLGISGYAKNLADGRVEIIAQGFKENIEQLIDWCRQGPSAAKVADVSWQWQEPGHNYHGFMVC